jgi:predicted nucleic acid-binding protein
VSYLLDTNVVSEIRRKSPNPGVEQWFASVSASELFLSVLVLGEIRQGIERLAPRNPELATTLQHWLGRLVDGYGDRVVPVTADVADVWGRLNVPKTLPVVDGLLAATALVRGWSLVTRNVKDVESTGVHVVNPWLTSI